MTHRFLRTRALIVDVFVNKKLWMTILGVSTLQALYWHSVYWMVTVVPADKVAAYESMFQTNHHAIVVAILSYLGIQGVVDAFGAKATTATQVIGSILSEKKESKTENIEHIIIDQDSPDAPKMKPFTQIDDIS